MHTVASILVFIIAITGWTLLHITQNGIWMIMGLTGNIAQLIYNIKGKK